jgi:hypothetical protein
MARPKKQTTDFTDNTDSDIKSTSRTQFSYQCYQCNLWFLFSPPVRVIPPFAVGVTGKNDEQQDYHDYSPHGLDSTGKCRRQHALIVNLRFGEAHRKQKGPERAVSKDS